MRKSRFKIIFISALLAFTVLIAAILLFFYFSTKLDEPDLGNQKPNIPTRIKVAENYYSCGNSWLRKNETGLWEMYISGSAYERGLKAGLLTKELIAYQEQAFINQITKMIPSKTLLSSLRYFLMWFNRGIDKYIPQEYIEEIYGISRYASSDFSFIGSNYGRILNYHAAHDIGHALQNMNIVGCTSFVLWGDRTESGELLVGRNFDFYVGDEFARNKIIEFVAPEKGNKFAFITWGGMLGVVSGMNDKGLTVTLNAAKSSIPTGARTPISILAREILQYASNIKEAFAIAKKRETFVSESILLASATDGKAVVIEKVPKNYGNNLPESALYENANQIICTNHFQSNQFKNSKLNAENLTQGSSLYRFERTGELLSLFPKLNYLNASWILRNIKGRDDTNIGLGNEKAVNQLIAHHSVIFEPEKRLIWISTSPYQLGRYLCYDLKKIFSLNSLPAADSPLYEAALTIPADTALLNNAYPNFQNFKKYDNYIRDLIHENKNNLQMAEIEAFIGSNPEFYQTYLILGEYFMKFKKYPGAVYYFRQALSKEIPNQHEVNAINEKIKECLEQ